MTVPEEMLKALSAPFTMIGADGKVYPAHQWKVNTTNTGVAVCVPYLDARQVVNRLNEVFGVDGWSNLLLETNGLGMICEITANIEGKEIRRSNIGTAGEYQREKSMVSDAIKRAATNFGIGAYLYDMQPVSLKLVISGGKKYAAMQNGEILKTGDELTSYINTLHPLRLKLTEIFNSISKEKQPEYSEIFTKIWEELS